MRKKKPKVLVITRSSAAEVRAAGALALASLPVDQRHEMLRRAQRMLAALRGEWP